MTRIHFIACASLGVFAGGGFLICPTQTRAEETSVQVEFSDAKPAPRATLPKMSDSTVFKLLLRGDTGTAMSKPARKPWVPQEHAVPTDAELAPASFLQNDEFEPIEPLAAARPGMRSETDGTIPKLRSQHDLFSSLWGENDEVEAEHRFFATRVPLGSPVRTIEDEQYGERLINGAVYTWSAPAFFHHPLYFEQVNLERYGQGPHHAIQPLYSAAHFFATIPKLPYHVTTAPPSERVYTLGHYRPGNCAPYQWHHPRFTWKGVIVQGLATAGTAVALP